MTDEQIIKALENCGNVGECKKCSLNEMGEGISLCIPHLTQNTLDLINRQKAEIEKKDKALEIADKMQKGLNKEIAKLRAENEDFKKVIETMTNEQFQIAFDFKAEIDRLKTMNSEMCIGMKVLKERAYNKFADRLCKKLGVTKNYAIDEVLREMVGDDNG